MLIKNINLTDKKRILAFGDIHGELNLLLEAYRYLQVHNDDFILALGDTMDRGTRSFDAALHFLTSENRMSVLGNHEDMFVRGWLEGDRESALLHLTNGGDWCDSYDTETLRYLANKIRKNFPYVIKAQFHGMTLAFAHADLPEKITKTNIEHSRKTVIWNHKSHELSKKIAGVNLAVHGHKIMPSPTLVDNRLYIDTCAGALCDELDPTHGLTCLEITKDDVFIHRFHKLYGGRIHYDVLGNDNVLISNLKERLFQ